MRMYLDPGFGSMVIQLLVAGLAAGAAMAGIFRSRIKAFFQKKKGNAADGHTDDMQ